MAYSFSSPLTGPPAPRRRRFWRVTRQCVGSLIMMAGMVIIALDLVSLATS